MTDLITVGRVGRPHGLDGAFVVENGSDDPDRFRPGAVIYVGGQRREVVLSRRVGGGRRAIKLDAAVDRGLELCVRADQLGAAGPDAYYVFQLIGLEAVSSDGSVVGRVKDVMPGVANDNLELDTGALVPMIEDAVLDIDLAGGRVVLNSTFID